MVYDGTRTWHFSNDVASVKPYLSLVSTNVDMRLNISNAVKNRLRISSFDIDIFTNEYQSMIIYRLLYKKPNYRQALGVL